MCTSVLHLVRAHPHTIICEMAERVLSSSLLLVRTISP